MKKKEKFVSKKSYYTRTANKLTKYIFRKIIVFFNLFNFFSYIKKVVIKMRKLFIILVISLISISLIKAQEKPHFYLQGEIGPSIGVIAVMYFHEL